MLTIGISPAPLKNKSRYLNEFQNVLIPEKCPPIEHFFKIWYNINNHVTMQTFTPDDERISSYSTVEYT